MISVLLKQRDRSLPCHVLYEGFHYSLRMNDNRETINKKERLIRSFIERVRCKSARASVLLPVCCGKCVCDTRGCHNPRGLDLVQGNQSQASEGASDRMKGRKKMG